MDRVAAEVAQEVRVLFEDYHAPPLPREEEAENESRRPTAHNADVGGVGHAATLLRSCLRRASIALAMDFRAWRLLVRQRELSDSAAVELMTRAVGCAGEGD